MIGSVTDRKVDLVWDKLDIVVKCSVSIARIINLFILSYLTSNCRKVTNSSFAAWKKNLFIFNEQALEKCQWNIYFFLMYPFLFSEVDAAEWGKFLHTKNKVCFLSWCSSSVINMLTYIYLILLFLPLTFMKKRCLLALLYLLYYMAEYWGFCVLPFMSRKLLKTCLLCGSLILLSYHSPFRVILLIILFCALPELEGTSQRKG